MAHRVGVSTREHSVSDTSNISFLDVYGLYALYCDAKHRHIIENTVNLSKENCPIRLWLVTQLTNIPQMFKFKQNVSK
jgi:hypothetical protein